MTVTATAASSCSSSRSPTRWPRPVSRKRSIECAPRACRGIMLYAARMHEAVTDAELLRRYRHGDMHAFDALYARHRVPLFNFQMNHSGRKRQEVEEVFQETWLKVIRNHERFDAAQAFAPWLY